MQNLSEKITEKFGWRNKLQALNPGITIYRATFLSNYPEKMNADEIVAFSKVLEISVTDLINLYGAGREVLTLSEVEELTSQKVSA